MFDIPKEYVDAASQSLSGSSAVLPPPYPAPEMYWRNGDSALASIADIKTALRFGGWGVDADSLSKIDDLPPQLPNTWQLHENLVSKSNGKQYNAYLTRTAHVAPIVRRYRWNTYNNRSEVQYLCYLAERDFQPWGFVVLSAKSLDTKVLDSVFKEFEVKTEKLREGTPINYFYIAIGTFGDAPKFETRHGKGGSTSQVTPPQLWTPKDGHTPETIKACFVGKEVAADIYVALNDPAVKEWVEAWKAKDNGKQQQPDEMPQPPDAEDGFPF